MPPRSDATMQKIPLTIIGGYLGAGKTTLVNHLLRHAGGLRLAVLVNEFGALPIDGDLIESETDTVISIAGGCVCCSFGDDLVMGLLDLANGPQAVDHVLLEASGVGLPGAIGATIGLLSDYVLDGVVVIADAETIQITASDRYMGDTVSAQLAQADILILNKTDLVCESELAASVHWLRSRAPQARIVTAVRGALPPEVVLESFLGRERSFAGVRLHGGDAFVATTVDVGEPVDPEAFAMQLVADGFIRAKGFVRGRDGALTTVQVVGRRFELWPAPDGVTPGIVGIRPRTPEI
jgi:G3E family GTPase